MLQILYASAAVVPFTPDDLGELLRRAREKNTRLGVSGLLVYDRGAFLQAIEGPGEAVRALYETIYEDPRHTNMVVILRREVPGPSFPGWGMGFVNAEHHDLSGLPGYADYTQALAVPLARVDSEAAWRVLDGFRAGKWRRVVSGEGGGR